MLMLWSGIVCNENVQWTTVVDRAMLILRVDRDGTFRGKLMTILGTLLQ